jgi:hypothetical protein
MSVAWKKQLLVLATALLAGMMASLALAETKDLDAKFTLSGQVRDMWQHTSSGAFTFRVDFRDIRYSGNVQRTLLEHKEPGQVTVWLALRDTTLTIDRTDICGSRHNAQCGPMQVVLGNRRDLWLAFDVEYKLENEQATLTVLKTRFGLPADNWYVGSPSWVSTSGLGMTQGKVIDGLRSGLISSPETIVAELIKVAPEIFAQIEERVEQSLSPERLARK